jgi:hypothetical protein
VDFSAADAKDMVQYFAGPRYLYGGDDVVTEVASDKANGVWVKTGSGVTHISMPKKTMEQKASVYEDLIKSVNDRRGMVANSGFTFSDMGHTYVDYSSTTGSFKGTPGTDDNDGLWTAMYAIGEIFRYRTLQDEYGSSPTSEQQTEIDKARSAAVRATKAVLLLDYISGRGNGFPCRSYMLTSEASAQTSDGTDYGYQNQNGLWFHMVPGGTDPNGDDPDAIGYSIVRVTGDAQTKWGSQLFPGSNKSDPMSYNGFELSNEAIDKLNESRAEGDKLGTDIYTIGKDTQFVMPVIASSSNTTYGAVNTSTSSTNKPVFQLTVPIYEKIPKFFNDLFPNDVSRDSNGFIDQSQIVYKADTSSDEVDGHYALFFTAYTYLCDGSTTEVNDLKPYIAQAADRMTKLILKDDHYYIEDATGKSTQWSRWLAKYFNDRIGLMEEQPLWEVKVGVDEDEEDALSYGYEDGPLNALEVMSVLKTAINVTSEAYPEDQELFSKAYDLTFDAAGYSKEEPYVNGKGYINMALDYIERRLVRQATNAYDVFNKVASPGVYKGRMEDDSNTNGTLHNDWTQYINYSDEELGWFPVFELILQEKDPERLAQIVKAYDQWYSNEVREENPFYTFLYQLAHPTKNDVDLKASVRYLYRMPQYRIYFASPNARQDVFYIEPGDRDKKAQTNYALPLDETRIHKNNSNPFTLDDSYSKNSNYDYKAGVMDCGTVFTLSYWFGRYFDMIEE